jgi:hypothetical protein
MQPLLKTARDRRGIGEGSGDLREVASNMRAVQQQNPTGSIAPTDALAMRRSLDPLVQASNAQVASGSTPTDMTALIRSGKAKGLNEGLSAILPNFGEQSANTSELFGLSKALQKAEMRPTTLQTFSAKGPSAAAGRLLTNPYVLSRGAIASDRAGALFQSPQALRAALLAEILGQSSPQSPASEQP